MKTSPGVKLTSYWFKIIKEAASVVMKGFLKTASCHMNGYLKAAANTILKSEESVVNLSGFQNLFS
jgi:hypothetical protein